MADRSDIQPTTSGWRPLSYTCCCGWIDWGHALPGSALALKAQIDTERSAWPGLDGQQVFLDGQPAYIIWYGQEMGAGPIRVSAARHWIVRKGLTRNQRDSVALAIFRHASQEFEQLQGTGVLSIISGHSSFSPEDLVSNLLGFYRAFRGKSEAEMRQLCGEVSAAESERIWDAHLPNGFGRLRNPAFRPILFPRTNCQNPTFPSLLTSITPASRGTLWTLLRDRRSIPGQITNARATIHVSPDGAIRVR